MNTNAQVREAATATVVAAGTPLGAAKTNSILMPLIGSGSGAKVVDGIVSKLPQDASASNDDLPIRPAKAGSFEELIDRAEASGQASAPSAVKKTAPLPAAKKKVVPKGAKLAPLGGAEPTEDDGDVVSPLQKKKPASMAKRPNASTSPSAVSRQNSTSQFSEAGSIEEPAMRSRKSTNATKPASRSRSPSKASSPPRKQEVKEPEAFDYAELDLQYFSFL